MYRASCRVQRGNGIGSFFRGLFRFVKPLYSGAKEVGKEALKSGSNIIDMINKDPDQPVGNIFRKRFSEVKDNLEPQKKI
jgi:hypothetical protein